MNDVTVKKYDNSIIRVFHFDRLLKTTSQYLQFQSDTQLLISEKGEQKTLSYRTDFFMYPNKWFNIFMFYNEDESFHDAFCNFTMPPQISDSDTSFVDLDIDLIVMPDGSIRIEDEDEFISRAKLWKYPADFNAKLKEAIQEITSLVMKKNHPFDSSSFLLH